MNPDHRTGHKTLVRELVRLFLPHCRKGSAVSEFDVESALPGQAQEGRRSVNLRQLPALEILAL